MTKARDLANASTALSAVSATELGYLDGVTSPVQTQLNTKAATANVVNNTLADAKGDLIVGTGADTFARLAVSPTNGETIVADSSTATGLRYQPTQAAGRNYVINGGQNIWQRGTSFALSGGIQQYCADRWQGYSPNLGRTVTRQGAATTGFYARVARDSGNALTGLIYYGTSLESQTTVALIGKTVTMSFLARVGANYSGTTLTAAVDFGTGTDQNLFSGFTGQTTIATTNAAVTTSWQRFSITGTISASATQVGVYFYYGPTGTAGANDWFEIDDIQLELGSVATTFTPAGGTIQGELAACQRYYYRTAYDSPFSQYAAGVADGTTSFTGYLQMPVTMRVAPTAVEYAFLRSIDGPNDYGAPSAVTINTFLNNRNQAAFTISDTGYTVYRPMYLQANNNAGSYLAVTAEL